MGYYVDQFHIRHVFMSLYHAALLGDNASGRNGKCTHVYKVINEYKSASDTSPMHWHRKGAGGL